MDIVVLPSMKPKDIIYCISCVQIILNAKSEFVYTDGHAINKFSNYFNSSDVININKHVDFEATYESNWKKDSDLDLKRRKEAEFLIKQDLDYGNILGFATFDNDSRTLLIDLGIKKSKVVVKPNYYF